MFWHQTKVFISYRRDDGAVHARALYGSLALEFGPGHVFFDVEGIDYGDAFASAIDQRIKACDVVVAVIGPQWLTLAGADGQPRIRSPRDYVRHEIASALRRRKGLIPVLIGGAGMPERAQLPDDIAGLNDINGLTFSDRQLGEDVGRLVDAIRKERGFKVVGLKEWQRLLRWLGLAAALLMFFAAWLGVFDRLYLDTRTAGLTLWLADVLAPVAASNEVQMVVIGPQTELALDKRFARNPAARRDHAQLIRRLSQAGARTVAFDIFITTPSPADDALLIDAITQARALNTAIIFGARDIEAGRPAMLPALREAVSTAAMLCYGVRLGYASTVPLVSQSEAAAVGSNVQADTVGLALAAAYPGGAKIASGARKVIVSGKDGIREFPYSETEAVVDPQECKIGSTGGTVATALYRAAPLAALNSAERRIAYEAVLKMDDAALRKRFSDKSVLVGLVMPGDDAPQTFHGLESETRHGLELHADAAGALLGIRRVVQPLGFGAQFAAMAALGLLGTRVSQWRRPGLGWIRVVALVATVALCVAAAVALCAGMGRLMNLTYPLGALAVGYWFAARAARAR